MRTAEGILEEYRKGGLCERLNLYLEYRDLRRQFMQIDSDERAIHKDHQEKECLSPASREIAESQGRV